MITLRPYQEKLIAMARDEIRKGNRKILLVLPTGGGKSHVMGEISSGALSKGHKVLALMHRRQLVTQLCDRFSDCGVDPGVIMSGHESSLGKECQIATCQTYGRRVKLSEGPYNPFQIDAEVVLIDEAHHALSNTYKNILENYKDKIVIGVTATPVLSSGVGMGRFFDSIVAPVTVQELIDGGYLVPGEYYGPSAPDLSGIKTVAGDYEKKGLEKVMNQPQIVGDVVQNWLRIAGGMKTMVFAVKVNHSKAIVREFQNCGITAEHLDAHSDDYKREETLKRFRSGETQVLSNVGLYVEGTDIKEIACIVLARPTKSLGLHMQMVGRGARPYPGKDKFIVIDHGGNINRLGFYEDEIAWSLNGKEPGATVKKPRVKERRILNCDNCSCAFTGPRCPQCGTQIKDYGKKIDALDAELVKLSKKKEKFTKEQKIKWFAMLEYHRRIKGYQPGWAKWKYRERIGCWPVGLGDVGPIEPDAEVKNWIKYLAIKRRKELESSRLPLDSDKLG